MGWYDVPRPIVPDLIVQHGRNQASKPALLCGERRWTWAGFDAATNQVANGLLQLNLAPGARLAVLMQNSAEMALLLFGAGKAGVSVVPLNTSVSDAAVAAMVRDSGANAIAASGEHCRAGRRAARGRAACRARSASSASTRPLTVTGRRSRPGSRDSQPPHRRSRSAPDTECNIIYSSGTTGSPEGHRAYARLPL